MLGFVGPSSTTVVVPFSLQNFTFESVEQIFGSLLLGRIEGVVHVDGGDDVPGAPRSPGEDDEVPGTELSGGALRRALHGGARLASHDVARLPRSVAQRVPPRRTAPPATTVFQRQRVTR